MCNVISGSIPHCCLKIMWIMTQVLSLYSFLSMAAQWLVNTFLAGKGIIAVKKSAWHIIYEKPSQLDCLVLNFKWLGGKLPYKAMVHKARPDFKASTLVARISMGTATWPGFPAGSTQPAETMDNSPLHGDGCMWTKSWVYLTADIWRRKEGLEPCPTKCCAPLPAAELKDM